MNNLFPMISDMIKGVLSIVIGTVLLLHTLGWVQRGLNIIIIVCAVALIFYGIFIISKQTMIKNYIDKMKGRIKKK